MRLLLAEDEKELADALAEILKYNHYSVDMVHNGQDALDYGLCGNYDGIIMDIMMPRMNGLEVLTLLRQEGVDAPVLLLTAKGEVKDRIAGLDAGADDYLPKPFAVGELLARVRAMTRRSSEFMSNIISCGNIRLDRNKFELVGDGVVVRLSNKEYQILEMLMANPNRIISTEQFIERIWGYDTDTEANVIWVYISNLRKKLQSMKASVEIKAARGRGYCLEVL